VGGEPLKRRPPQRLLIVREVTQARGGSWSGDTAVHDVGWSSKRPPGRRMAGAELRHRVVVGAVTDGDREREERTRCSVDRERGERTGVVKKVWLRFFLCCRAVQNFVRVLARVPNFF
jgi:hypothetical protein